MKKKYNKIVISILFVIMFLVILFGLYLNIHKANLQGFHQGNYVEINNQNNYFNLNLDNHSIEYYNGECYLSEIQVLDDNILVTEIEPFGECLLIAENGTKNIDLIIKNNDKYGVISLQFKGKEFIKIEHH